MQPAENPSPVPASAAAALAFEDVRKSYGEVEAVRGVSFDVRVGEVLGLLGPNGAGKTTLIRILMDILRPTSGSVRVFGEPFRRQALDRIGYLPEERGLYRKRKVRDVLLYFGMLKGRGRRQAHALVDDWLQRVGLEETAGWRIDRLSKGMSQKIQIAATLMTEPELCVLDEPFSGLDPVNVRLVRGLIRERQEAGRTTILSTHQMDRVEELCDRVALIHRGRLLVYGPVAEVRRSYSTRSVRIEATGPLPQVRGIAAIDAERDGVFLARLEDGVPAAVLRELLAAGVDVTGFQEVLAPMEEVFVRAVGEDRDQGEEAVR